MKKESIVYTHRFAQIDLDYTNNIAIISISKQSTLNAINYELMDDIYHSLEHIADNKNINCLIISGMKGCFSSGADTELIKKLNTDEEARKFCRIGKALISDIEDLSIPVIAVLDKYVLGGGLELALSCDIRICTKDAIFQFPETGLGIIPGWGGTQRLARIIGEGRAKYMIYTNSIINADTAYDYGLANHVCDNYQDALDEAKRIATIISNKPKIAICNSKKAINDGLRLGLKEGNIHETGLFAECF